MLMIPSVGYFTAVSKNDASYVNFIRDNIRRIRNSDQDIDVIDENTLVEEMLGPLLDPIGWHLSFITENELFF